MKKKLKIAMGNENINLERKSKKGWQQSKIRNNFKKPANRKKEKVGVERISKKLEGLRS